MLVAGGALSVVYLYATESSEVAFEEIPYVAGAVMGSFGALSLLFLWNLACAPYRILQDRNLLLQAENDRLNRIVGQKPERRILSREQQSTISDALRHCGIRPDSLHVIFAGTPSEAAEFASDIGDAIKDAGFECTVHSGGAFPHDARYRGLMVFNGKGAVFGKLAEIIQGIFKEIGFIMERRTHEGSNSICIYVAKNAG